MKERKDFQEDSWTEDLYSPEPSRGEFYQDLDLREGAEPFLPSLEPILSSWIWDGTGKLSGGLQSLWWTLIGARMTAFDSWKANPDLFDLCARTEALASFLNEALNYHHEGDWI